MANILNDKDLFKERKKIEDIFLTYKPYSLKDALKTVTVIEETNEEDELDDELITIDLTNKKNSEKDINKIIEEEVDDC